MRTNLVTGITAYIKVDKSGNHITTLIKRHDNKNNVVTKPTNPSQIRAPRKSLLWKPPTRPRVYGDGTDGKLLEY